MKKPNPKREIESHRDFYWPTTDDWYPCYPRSTVRVRVSTTTTGGTAFARISVWGADDDGMERDHHCRTADLPGIVRELTRFADRLPNPLTKDWLTKQGFVRA